MVETQAPNANTSRAHKQTTSETKCRKLMRAKPHAQNTYDTTRAPALKASITFPHRIQKRGQTTPSSDSVTRIPSESTPPKEQSATAASPAAAAVLRAATPTALALAIVAATTAPTLVVL